MRFIILTEILQQANSTTHPIPCHPLPATHYRIPNSRVWRWQSTEKQLIRCSVSFKPLRSRSLQHINNSLRHTLLPTTTSDTASQAWAWPLSPQKCRFPQCETYWSRIRRWTVQNFKILFVTAWKIRNQCLQTAPACGGPQDPLGYSPK